MFVFCKKHHIYCRSLSGARNTGELGLNNKNYEVLKEFKCGLGTNGDKFITAHELRNQLKSISDQLLAGNDITVRL